MRLPNLHLTRRPDPRLAPRPHAAPHASQRAVPRRALAAAALALLALLAVLPPGCAGPPAAAPPALNARFLDPALDVDELVRIFEVETREIAARRDAIVAALGIHRGDAVADIGAGTGLFLQPLAQAVGAEGTVYAVDISPRLVEHLRGRAASEGLGNVRVVPCTSRSTGLPRASIDLAFVCDTYHHFEHPAETLASLHAALRPGGRLAIVDFERVPGVSRDWVLEHVRCDRETVIREVCAAGFALLDQPRIPGLTENYLLRFERL